MSTLGDLGQHRVYNASKPHTDKLAQAKLAEKHQRQAHKQQLQDKKAAKKQELLGEKVAMRRIRQLNGDSKRAKVEGRRAAKKEAHAATGATCEHGIWRCSICFPHASRK